MSNKKILRLVAILLLLNLLGVHTSYAGTVMQKFSRGLTNVATGVFEIFRQPVVLQKEYDYGPGAAFFGGIFKGVYAFVVREVAGVYEVVTFPIPLPKEYRSVIDPPTVFSEYELPRDYKK